VGEVEFPGTDLPGVNLVKRDGLGMRTSLPELVLPPATAAELEDRLAEGKFTRLALPGRELRPNSHVDWVWPRLSVKWDRTSSGVVDHGQGSWATFEDHLQIRCGALSQPYQELLATTSQNTVDATGKVTVIPGTTHVLVERTASYGIEGESGTQTDAILIDLTGCHILR